MLDDRPDRIEYLMGIAMMASVRSTCPRRHVGSVLATSSGKVISTGYNGSPPGFVHCGVQCCMHNGNCINTVHAEINALVNARERGDIVVSTDAPCINCFKALIAHNPKISIYYWRDYNDPARDQFIEFQGRTEYLWKVSDESMDRVRRFMNACLI